MSVHGKGDEGYILLDVLLALFLLIVGLGALYSALDTAVNHGVKNDGKLMEAMIFRNERACDFESIRTY